MLGLPEPAVTTAAPAAVPTVAAFVEDRCRAHVMANHKAAAGTLHIIDKVLVPAFGPLPLDAITRAVVDAWSTRRLTDDEVSAATVNRNVGDLKAALGVAVRWGPAQGVPAGGA